MPGTKYMLRTSLRVQIYNPQNEHKLRDFRLRRNVEEICAPLGYYAT